MKIIGMAGLARSGKDTAGDYLVIVKGYKKLSFAQPIKNMVTALLQVDETWIMDPVNKETPIDEWGYSPRELMQTLGTEWGRQTLNKNFWVDILNSQIQKAISEDIPGVVITDCRFNNETKMIRDLDGIIGHISRSEPKLSTNHLSEKGVEFDGSDYILNNTGSIEELYSEIEHMLIMYPTLVRLRR